jgi:hypothetical protein
MYADCVRMLVPNFVINKNGLLLCSPVIVFVTSANKRLALSSHPNRFYSFTLLADVLRFDFHDDAKPPTDVPWLSDLTLLREFRFDSGLGTLPEAMGRLSNLSNVVFDSVRYLLICFDVLTDSTAHYVANPYSYLLLPLIPLHHATTQKLPTSVQKMASGLTVLRS